MTSMFAVQLGRHPSLSPLPWKTMCAKHPAKVGENGQRVVPAVHRGPDGAVSIFINPGNKYAYKNCMLPDGRTVEFHPSNSPAINRELHALVGREVTLYAQLGREARQGRVVVEHPEGLQNDVFHLRLVPAVPLPAVAPPPPAQTKKVLWADME